MLIMFPSRFSWSLPLHTQALLLHRSTQQLSTTMSQDNGHGSAIPVYFDHDSATDTENPRFRTEILIDNAFHDLIIFSILHELGACQHIYLKLF